MYRSDICSRRSFAAAAFGLFSPTPVFAREPKVETPAYNQLTDEQEVSLGRQAAQAIERNKNLRFIDAWSVKDYVEDIFQKIVQSSRRPNLPYSIKIVDTREINAFALPGGFVYLNRGLMEWARSESELVATLCHEVGHVVGRHGANAISRQSTVDSLISEASQMFFGEDLPGRLLKQVGGPVEFFTTLTYSRVQESEADLFGYYNMQRAGWDSKGMLELFRHLAENSSVLDPLFTFTSTHPSSAEREGRIAEETRESPPKRGLTFTSEHFRSIQTELRKMPVPKVKEKLSKK